MPGLQKMTNGGLGFLRKLYKENPAMPFRQILPIYNEMARTKGWRCICSSGTIGYHLSKMGLYKIGSRAISIDIESACHRKIRHKIELNANGKAELTKIFGVSVQNVSQALLFSRNSPKAHKIRDAALKNGGKLLEIKEIETTETIKILSSKGEVEKIVTL